MEDFETDQRKLEHDFNNQMMVVMGMMEMGEWMAAEDMLGGDGEEDREGVGRESNRRI